ncbi:MAG: tetratricopeptide repeat protein [Pseudomonadota bacterium]|jgi:putative thioredoxin
MSEFTLDVNVQNFEREVLEASRKVPVLVDFWAAWCAPCRALKPILEKLAREYQGRFRLAKVNSDENQALAYRFGVRGIPNVKAFVNGEVVDEFTGALPEAQVREFIERLLPSPAEPLRQEALAAKARGENAVMRQLLLRAIELDPRHEAARLDLVEVLAEAGELQEAERLLAEIADHAKDRARAEALRARLALAGAAPRGADAGKLRTRIAADPADLEARLELANWLALHQDYRPALEQLLEIVRRDRGFRDDIGRKTMLQIFNLLGSDSDLVREFRSALASAINR